MPPPSPSPHSSPHRDPHPGASALFQKLTPSDGATASLPELKTLVLANNAIGDTGTASLAGACAVGAFRGCKIGLDGNPATRVSRKAVQKAQKKAKG